MYYVYSSMLKLQIYGNWVDSTVSSLGDGKYQIEINVPSCSTKESEGMILYCEKMKIIYHCVHSCKWNVD